MIKYASKLDVLETQAAIRFLRADFEDRLCEKLNLARVSAPLFVKSKSGINDDLNGVERPVAFDILETGEQVEIVHSLAKWKRLALYKYKFPVHSGLYTNMNAIRRDEKCDNLHSLYVDQWDWEKVIVKQDRTKEYLVNTVKSIYGAIFETATAIEKRYPEIKNKLSKEITVVTTQELEDRYPNLDPKDREKVIAKEYGAVFVMQIGAKLRSGKKHDGRAPDYDDWNLNGDLIVYYPLLDVALEISSMGIRVDKESLLSQLKSENAEDRLQYEFHSMLVDETLPLTIGGGIGQSRMSMLLLHKAHIGEVHASVWPTSEIKKCQQLGIKLL